MSSSQSIWKQLKNSNNIQIILMQKKKQIITNNHLLNVYSDRVISNDVLFKPFNICMHSIFSYMSEHSSE